MKCEVCNKKPEEIQEYVDCGKEENMTPEQYVASEEGTYNPHKDLFCCTNCYIKIGMPLGQAGNWK